MGVFAEYGHHCARRLFQSDGDRPAAKTLFQFTGPDLDRFRGVLQLAVLDVRLARGLQGPSVFLIGPVQSHESGKVRGWLRWVHLFSFPVRWGMMNRQGFASAKAL